MAGLKESGQAVGAQVLTQLTGFAPPTIMAQASRLMARQRMFNLVVTNVPGPQFPLYLMGHELRDLFPMVPLARNQALGVAIMSYNGKMNFGLVGDYDAMHDLDDLADDFRASLAELADAAGVAHHERARARASSRAPKRPPRTTLPGVREKVKDAARELGLDVTVKSLEQSTKTVRDAAAAVGCDEAMIAKSIVFVCDGEPVVCVTSGAHRVDVERVALALDCAEARIGDAGRGPRGHRAIRSAACRRSGTGCRSSSTRRCCATSGSGPPAATRTASSRSTRAS